MKKIKQNIFLTTFLLSVSVPVYASELHGLGEFLLNLIFGFISFIIGLFFMFWFFRKDSTFVLFSISNLLLFFFLFLLRVCADVSDSDVFANVLTVFFFIMIIAQVIAIIKASIKKFKNTSAD